ncbi:nucleotide-diphospho-sugar transferase [Tricharina praecox]|uniref:nucleotide-diphospho-sugar transferase n=1 Tax=Tricharina praecox TaxID=43433 RepID=UPI00221F8AC4|nr:nucleotide-diphospho-sugar transferase [Tricharina praecox]KAI5851059.1 nucleotide-diphospho-sugar transferase [Tricharina praecox]
MPSAHPSIGFQAVILCGPGTGLYPFTGAEDLPKALLPIANKPMLHYPLEWCEKAGFDSILVLTLKEHHAAIQSYIRSHRTFKAQGLYIQAEEASSINDNLGTADVLRIAFQKGWLNSDFAVIPCDLVTNLEGHRLAELWMVLQAGFDADLGRRSRKHRTAGDGEDGRRGGLVVCYDTMGEGAVKGQETDLIAVAPVTKPMMCSSLPEGDVGVLLTRSSTQALKGVSEIPIRHSMLRKHPNMKLYSTFRDAGICFLPHWVLKFIERNPSMTSLREDVLPWLAKSRWQNRRLAEKLGLMGILTGSETSATGDNDSQAAGEEYDVGSMSTMRLRRADDAPAEIPPMLAYLPNAPSMFMRRVDTTHLYLYTSLYLAKSDPSQPSTQIKIDPGSTIGEKAVVTGADCLIADKVTVGAKAIVKKSVLGYGVTIGRGARLMGCVLMDGATVEENAKLEGCTVGRKAIIGAKSVLKDCEIAENYYVEKETEAKGERFVDFAGLEAASDEDEVTDENSDDGVAVESDDDEEDDE